MISGKLPDVKIEYDELGFVKGYVCPRCNSQVKFSHADDTGTKFFKCEKCGETSAKLKTLEKTKLEKSLKDMTKPVTLDKIAEILNSTIKHDEQNKLATLLCMLLTYTNEDQFNIGFTAESSTGKSYIPLEVAWYFPKSDVLEYGYVSPQAFFHEYGTLLPDPTDHRNIEDEKKRKIMLIDLSKKILIFMDQPHDMVLQRLRPLLSHDRKTIIHKIADRKQRLGLKTKTVLIKGYCTVIFCTAKFSMEQQERTRLLLLSPETNPEKIKEAIFLKIEKESDRKAFHEAMESNPERTWLRSRIKSIKEADIQNIVIPEELRSEIADRFFKKHNSLSPRHQRDISRLISIIKAHALLNLWHRTRPDPHSIIAHEEDVNEGFRLYQKFSTANELGLPPEVFNIFEKLKSQFPDNGVTKREFATKYYETFHRTLGKKRLDQILDLLLTVGLLTEERDSQDKRLKRYVCTGHGTYISETLDIDENSSENPAKLNTLRHGGGPIVSNNNKNIPSKHDTPENIHKIQSEKLPPCQGVYSLDQKSPYFPMCRLCNKQILKAEPYRKYGNLGDCHDVCIKKDEANRK